MRSTRATVLTLLIGLCAAGVLAQEASAAKIRFVPDRLDLRVGESARVVVEVDSPTEVAAMELSLNFDPLALQLQDPNAAFAPNVPAFAPLGGTRLCPAVRQVSFCRDPQWLLTATGRNAFGIERIDAAAGSASIAYGTAGAARPAAGQGALAILDVVAVAPGVTQLRLTDVILTDTAEPPARQAVRFDTPLEIRVGDANGPGRP